MSPTFLINLPHAAFPQEPKTTSDTPAPVQGAGNPAGPGPAGTAGTTAPGGTQAAPQGPCGGPEMLIYMGVFLALMYFMVMRPEQKRKKEQQALLSSVKQGDRVVTTAGMHGVITKLTDKTVTLRVDTVQITFDRAAIARVERDDAATPPGKA